MPTPYDEWVLKLEAHIKNYPLERVYTTGKRYIEANSDTHDLCMQELKDMNVGDFRVIGCGAAATTILTRIK